MHRPLNASKWSLPLPLLLCLSLTLLSVRCGTNAPFGNRSNEYTSGIPLGIETSTIAASETPSTCVEIKSRTLHAVDAMLSP